MHFTRCVKNVELHRRQGVTKRVVRSTQGKCQNKHVTRDIEKIHTWHDGTDVESMADFARD